MNTLAEIVCQITGAAGVELGEVVQSLWSGYGVIQRAKLLAANKLNNTAPIPVVIKHIDITRARENRRGWSGETSHQRKIRSYEVESRFYESFAGRCHQSCPVPKLIACHELPEQGGWVLVLQDLDSAGFNLRKERATPADIQACLRWLAEFHATFLGASATGLWPVGTYWHLATRPDELAAMPDSPLKNAASRIDGALNAAQHQTLVHGDAKLANFCFADPARNRVAAVDFQYVGRGCGMKDVAYFISSCLDDKQAAEQQESLLTFYFKCLHQAIEQRQLSHDYTALESEWRRLYPLAWADFCRFLIGWSPGHWKLNGYTDRITQQALHQIAHH